MNTVEKAEKMIGKQFKIYGDFETPLFLAKDVAERLDLTNVSDMISRVDTNEVTKLNLGGLQGECNFLTEDGLYEVLMQSRKPIAKAFKKEVKETTINNPDGSIRVTKTTKVTGAGQQFFINMFLAKAS